MRRPRRGGGPARRAVVRWAWRLFRAEWRQQLLVLALVAIAVTTSVASTAAVVAGSTGSRGRFGDAAATVQLDGSDPAAARRAIAAARTRFGALEVVGHGSLPIAGSVEVLDVRAQDPDGPEGRSLLAERSGRYPTATDQVALTDGARDRLDVDLGGRVEIDGRERTVVGIVENPADLDDEFVLVPVRDPAATTSFTLLLASFDPGGAPAGPPPGRSGGAVDDTGDDDPSAGATPGFAVQVAGDERAAVVAVVLVITTVTLALVSLLSAAGFIVLAHRRRRQLGLLAALGATDRHLRLVVLANGAIVGLVASVVGTVLGVAAWVAVAPVVERAAGHRVDRFDLPWQLIGTSFVLAVGLSVVAAWWPARMMARTPVVAALARRPRPPRAVHRSALVAVALVAAGMAAIAAADPLGHHVRPLVLIGGLVSVVAGTVLAAPAAIRLAGAPAAHLPFAARLALRDLVRNQARAAAALAATVLALAIAVSVVVVAQADEHGAAEGNLSDREVVIRVGDPASAPDPELPTATRHRLDAAIGELADDIDGAAVVPLDVAVNPATAADAALRRSITLASVRSARSFEFAGTPYVATPALLQRLDIDASTIDDDVELVTTRTDDVILLDETVRPDDDGDLETEVRHVDGPAYGSDPSSLITAAAVEDHGWVRARAGWLVEAPAGLTGDQLAHLRQGAATLGLEVEARSTQDELAALRSGATTVGGALALAIVALAIGLLRGEATGDLRTLTATGATARTRRALTAVTAGTLALLGTVLSTTGAYLALAAAYHADLGRLTPAPARDLLLLVVGVPVVAALAGYALAGREPSALGHQPTA